VTYTTVSTISSATLLRGLVYLDVLDNEVFLVQSLDIGIRFSVLEKIDQELCGLLGPTSTGNSELFAYIIL
jgi:hypothetical protein